MKGTADGSDRSKPEGPTGRRRVHAFETEGHGPHGLPRSPPAGPIGRSQATAAANWSVPLPLLTAHAPKSVSVSRTLPHSDTTRVRDGETRLEFPWGDDPITTASTRRTGFTAWSFSRARSRVDALICTRRTSTMCSIADRSSVEHSARKQLSQMGEDRPLPHAALCASISRSRHASSRNRASISARRSKVSLSTWAW